MVLIMKNTTTVQVLPLPALGGSAQTQQNNVLSNQIATLRNIAGMRPLTYCAQQDTR